MRKAWIPGVALCLPLSLLVLFLFLNLPVESQPLGADDLNPMERSQKLAACIGDWTSPCSEVEFGLHLINDGPQTLEQVRVVDPLPAEIVPDLETMAPGLEYDGAQNTVHWEGTLMEGETTILSFTVSSVITAPIDVTNAATICVDALAGPCFTRAVSVTVDPVLPTATPTPTVTPTATPTSTLTPTPKVRLFLPLIIRFYPEPPPPTSTPTPARPVNVDMVWTEGPKGNLNDNLRRCEVLYSWVQLTNVSESAVRINISWEVRDWSGKLVSELSYPGWQVDWPSGSYRAVLARAIPSNATWGPYSLTVKAGDGLGNHSERTSYFWVTETDPVTSPLADFVTARGVDHNRLPVGESNWFSTGESRVYAWGWWQRADGRTHTLRWDWYGPNGKLFGTYDLEVSDTCTFYAWAWLSVAGTEAANMSGIWTVNVSRDNQFVGSRNFALVAGMAAGEPAEETGAFGGGHMQGPCGLGACVPVPVP